MEILNISMVRRVLFWVSVCILNYLYSEYLYKLINILNFKVTRIKNKNTYYLFAAKVINITYPRSKPATGLQKALKFYYKKKRFLTRKTPS